MKYWPDTESETKALFISIPYTVNIYFFFNISMELMSTAEGWHGVAFFLNLSFLLSNQLLLKFKGQTLYRHAKPLHMNPIDLTYSCKETAKIGLIGKWSIELGMSRGLYLNDQHDGCHE